MAVYHGGVVKQAEGDWSSMNRGEGERLSTVAPDRSLGALARSRFEAVPEFRGSNLPGMDEHRGRAPQRTYNPDKPSL
jgi:hypothetical protein